MLNHLFFFTFLRLVFVALVFSVHFVKLVDELSDPIDRNVSFLFCVHDPKNTGVLLPIYSELLLHLAEIVTHKLVSCQLESLFVKVWLIRLSDFYRKLFLIIRVLTRVLETRLQLRLLPYRFDLEICLQRGSYSCCLHTQLYFKY